MGGYAGELSMYRKQAHQRSLIEGRLFGGFGSTLPVIPSHSLLTDAAAAALLSRAAACEDTGHILSRGRSVSRVATQTLLATRTTVIRVNFAEVRGVEPMIK